MCEKQAEASVMGLLTDLQLPLDASLAALPVVRLGGVVLRHHLDKLAGQCGVLEKWRKKRQQQQQQQRFQSELLDARRRHRLDKSMKR